MVGWADSREQDSRQRLLSGARLRILAWYIGLLLLATAISVFLTRQILLDRLDDEIRSQLVQETQEFESLIGGSDPATGEPFGRDVRAIFDVYFSRNVPDEGEAIIAIAGPVLHETKRAHDVTYALEEERPDLIARWSALSTREDGTIQTPAGDARYLALPVLIDGGRAGTFVVLNYPAHERREIRDVVQVEIVVTLAVIVLASLLAWVAAGRVLRPLRLLDATARAISDSDLSRRIAVRGDDEVSRLARTFNDMLDRLEAAFTNQRRLLDEVGHELRTPLTIIRGHLEVLGTDPEEQRETVALLTDELDRMGRMVNDLLMLAKADQPDFLDLDTVDVELLTAEVHAKASALAPRAWSLESTGSGGIVADRQRITQALMQLADNAVRHTVEGDRIALGSALEQGEARFWVRDSGPGIPPTEQARVFERFVRGQTGQRAEGAGLGLAIVKAIAEAHHGRVELESRPGAGARFTLVLPATPAPPTRRGRDHHPPQRGRGSLG